MPGNSVLWPQFFKFLAIILFFIGIAETIASVFVMYYSGGIYIGGIYAGIVALSSSSRGFQSHTRGWMIFDTILLAATMVCGIVAVIIIATISNFVDDLEACSVYTSSFSNSCNPKGVATQFACYGNSDYFLTAEGCAANNNINDGADSHKCLCVTSDQTDNCYAFDHVDSCRRLVNYLPISLKMSLIFAIIGAILSIIMLVLMSFSLCCRKTCGLDESDDADISEPLIPTVVYPTGPPAPTAPEADYHPSTNPNYSSPVNQQMRQPVTYNI